MNVHAWSWPTETLTALFEVNDRWLALLIELAVAPAPTARFPLIEALRAEFSSLDPPARRRAARAPFLLLDLEFQNAAWWRQVQPLKRAGGSSDRLLPRRDAAPLARAALMLAWHLARSDRLACDVLLGLPQEVIERLSGFTPLEIDRAADAHCERLRPRWADRVASWRMILEAARDEDPAAQRALRLHALALLGGDLLLREAG